MTDSNDKLRRDREGVGGREGEDRKREFLDKWEMSVKLCMYVFTSTCIINIFLLISSSTLGALSRLLVCLSVSLLVCRSVIIT